MIRKIGDRLVLVGVAHVLPKSMDDVRDTIEEVQPEVVGVELCEARYFDLTTGSHETGGIRASLSRVGILAKILSVLQESIGKQTGMVPGEEMLTAVEMAKRTNAEIGLIDRSIGVTLQRLIDRMGFWEKVGLVLKLGSSFLLGDEEVELENITDEKVVEKLLVSLRGMSETVYEVLVEERNEYMAEQISGLMRARSGNIVCVVGAAHVPGLVEKMESRIQKEYTENWDSFTMKWESK